MNLFDLYAKISLDSSEYDSGVKDAAKSGDNLSDKLKNDLPKSADKAEKSIENVGNATGNMSDGFTVAKGVLSDFISSGIQKAIGVVESLFSSVVNLDSATEEYRVAQGKLNTAYEAAGYSAESAWEAYNGFYEILGDTDRATEASQLLAKLVDSEQDVTDWTYIAAGVFGTFGDSLPIEGLIEATNETVKVGQVTGVLADALNWAGISEDDFNKSLEKCSSESERNQLIMETLYSTYEGATDAFYDNNRALVRQRDSQTALTDAMAKAGEAISKIKTELLEHFAPAISEAAEKAANFISKIDVSAVITTVTNTLSSMANTFMALSPVIAGVTAAVLAYKTAMGIASLIQGVTTAINTFKAANEAATIAQAALNAVMNANPFVLIVTLIAGVVTALVTLWNTNEDFRNAIINIWNSIKSAIGNAIDAIGRFFTVTVPQKIDEMVQFFLSIPSRIADLGKNIVDSIKNGISNAWNGLVSWFNGLWDSLFGGRSVDVNVNGSANTSGSHAGGLDYVPYNGYIAELHRGETVLTRAEADEWRKGNAGISSIGNITITVNGAKYSDEESLVQRIAVVLENTLERKNAVYG